MKNTNNKLIAGLLAVIAVCMISIVAILLMNRSNGADGTQVVNEAVEENIAENEQNSSNNSNVTGDNETSMSAGNNNTEQGTGYNPYYKYEGELSEVPITPTKVENADILDQVMTVDDDFEEHKAALIEHILDVASEYEVYANPTIVKDGMYIWAIHTGMIVDLHTKNNDFLTILTNGRGILGHHTDSPERHSRVFSLNDEMSTPIMYGNSKNIYLFNRVDLYNIMLTHFDTPEEARVNADDYEKLIMETSIEWLQKYGTTSNLDRKEPLSEQEISTIKFAYLGDWSLMLNDDGSVKCIYFNMYMTGENNLHIQVAGCIDKDKNSYVQPSVAFDYVKN